VVSRARPAWPGRADVDAGRFLGEGRGEIVLEIDVVELDHRALRWRRRGVERRIGHLADLAAVAFREPEIAVRADGDVVDDARIRAVAARGPGELGDRSSRAVAPQLIDVRCGGPHI